MSGVITGAIAGLTATAPMTVAMEVMHRRLPAREFLRGFPVSAGDRCDFAMPAVSRQA